MLSISKNNLNRLSCGVIIMATTLAISSPLASAASSRASFGETIVTVKISASDLTSLAGAKRIYASFNYEAGKACDDPGTRGLAKRKLERVCAEDLVEDFVIDLNHPPVTSLHYGGEVTIE